MTGAELLLVGLRLHWRQFPDEFRATVEHLIDPAAPGAFDDLVPLLEEQIRQGHSHLRPWVACGRQVEAASTEVEAAVRDFVVETYEKARGLGWTPDRDLMDWVRERSGLLPDDFGEPQVRARAEPALRDDWA